LGVVTEVMDPRDVERVVQYADMLQTAPAACKTFRLARGRDADAGAGAQAWFLRNGSGELLAAEYVLLGGNENARTCERGVRSFDG
jgi:3-deoxy-D-arabino-heptulosonate 7-phosphate (DAHP) synthase